MRKCRYTFFAIYTAILVNRQLLGSVAGRTMILAMTGQ